MTTPKVTGEAADEVRERAPDIETLARGSPRSTTSSTRAWRRRCSWACACRSPCCSRARPGVGKTEAGKALAAVLDTPLIRLQCYEGIDAAEALYEWNYPRQLLSIRLADASGAHAARGGPVRPGVPHPPAAAAGARAPGPRPAVLLIDEIDRADDDFEAFLLELLAEASVTIPEIGTIVATHPPVIVLTSNRTRDLHDAVKRRCLYHWIDFPTSAARGGDRAPSREGLVADARRAGRERRLADARQRRAEAARHRRGDRLDGSAQPARRRAARRAAAVERTLGSVLKYSEDQDVIRAAGLEELVRSGDRHRRSGVETIELDLPAVAGALSRRLHEAGVPVTPAPLGRLRTRARAGPADQPAAAVLDGACGARVRSRAGGGLRRGLLLGLRRPRRRADGCAWPEDAPRPPRRPGARPSRDAPGGGTRDAREGLATPPGDGDDEERREVDVPLAMASDEERLAGRSFDGLEPYELAQLYRLMSRLRDRDPAATHAPLRARPARTARRHAADVAQEPAHGRDPIRLARRRRRVVPRRLVMLCDISGSMEPYARAYLQFLTCAAGSGPDAEAFVFATRLTRLTRALSSRNPERAIQRAAAAAPDWSSGTRIGDALKAFNDRHGRRGMARGAVVVILSDGWERGDPRSSAARWSASRGWPTASCGSTPASARAPSRRAPAAWWPRCRTVTRWSAGTASGRSARSSTRSAPPRGNRPICPAAAGTDTEQESWASATPVAGSSVAMPSGHGPSRGNVTPGWVTDGGE